MNPTHRSPRVSTVLPVLLVGSALLAIPFTAGPISAQQSHNVTLLAHLNQYDHYSSCWSYVHSDGREYAVELATTGASIVRLTDPSHPVEVGFIGLRTSFWHEARQYRNYIYITTEVFNGVPSANGLEIVSMADPDHPKIVGSFHPGIDWAHTLTIDADRGILYAAGTPNGMAIYSLADPEQPVMIGLYQGTPFTSNYIHTLYTHGTRGYASEIYDGEEAILDLTDPAHPVEIASFRTPARLTHSSWTSDDQRYLYVTDEYNGARLYVYDIQDLTNIHQVYKFEELSNRTTPHDPVIRGNLAFVSYYTAGAHFLDVRNPAWPVDVGYFDTYAGRDGGLIGCWEAAPMFPSGIFIASDTETGLYVLRPNLNYAIVRGTVTEAPNGPIVAGVTVAQSGSAAITHSYSDGRYAIAVDPGSVTLQTSMFAFNPLVKTVTALAGSDQTLNLKIQRGDAGSITGTVTRSSDQAPLSEAEIQVLGTPLTGLTDANGAYAITAPVGSYQVRCARPGQVPKTTTVTVTKNHASTVGFNLATPLFYDDAEIDRGWTPGAPDDNADRGIWIRDVPLGTHDSRSGEQAQTDHDRTPSPGTKCFLTGNGTPGFDTFIGEQSVRDGKTTLTTPVLHMGGVQDPRVGFWRWYANFIGDAPWDDPFITQLSSNGGQTWTTIDSLLLSEPGWNFVEIPIANYIQNPGDVMLRFIAEEQGEFSIVEAAIDDFSMYSGVGTGPSAAAPLAGGALAPAAAIERLYPSPTRQGATMELSLSRETEVRAELYDVQGRLVRTVFQGRLPAGVQVVPWDGRTESGAKAAAGVYWLRIDAAGIVKSSKLIVVR